jgi:nitrous oxidase accessory protein NosD
MREYSRMFLANVMGFCVEANVEKTKHVIMIHKQTSGQNNNKNTDNKFFANMAKFKYLGTRFLTRTLLHGFK